MTTSRNVAIGLRRLFSFLPVAALAFGAATVSAQQSPLVGHWRGVDRGVTLNLVIQTDGQFNEHLRFGTQTIRQSGHVKLLGTDGIAFVTAPSASPINLNTPPGGGSSASQPLGTVDTYVFSSVNRIIFTNRKTHNSVTLNRVP